MKNLEEYHDLYVETNTIMSADVFVLDAAKFLSAPWLLWQAALTNKKKKLDPLTDIDMLLIVETDIRGGLCHSFFGHAKSQIIKNIFFYISGNWTFWPQA